MKNYIERTTKKIEEFRGQVDKAGMGNENKNEKQIPNEKNKITLSGKGNEKINEKNNRTRMIKRKQEHDICDDFYNLFQLRGLEQICQSHSELVKAYKSKIDGLKKEMQELFEQRKTTIRNEQLKFLEAKKQGTRALINYKLSKAKFRKQVTEIEKKFAQTYQHSMSQVEESIALNRLKQMEENKNRAYGYMYTSQNSTKTTKIIAAGNNVQFATNQIKKLEAMQNITNQMIAKIKSNKADEDTMGTLNDQLEQINDKLQEKLDLVHASQVKSTGSTNNEKMQAVMYYQSLIRVAMKRWKYLKSYNNTNLMSA
jgi:hypothetical protein